MDCHFNILFNLILVVSGEGAGAGATIKAVCKGTLFIVEKISAFNENRIWCL